MLPETIAALTGITVGAIAAVLIVRRGSAGATQAHAVAEESITRARREGAENAAAHAQARTELEQAAAQAASAAAAAEEAAARQRHALEAALAAERAAANEEREALRRDREALEAGRQTLARDRAEAAEATGRATEARERLDRREAAVATRELALAERDAGIDRRLAALDTREARLRERESAAQGLESAVAARDQAATERAAGIDARLAAVAGLTPEQARAELLARLDAELTTEQSELIARRGKELAARSKELAVEVVSRAIQRYAAEHTAETTTAKITLADEEHKGRIIGKEGRNIKAFEQATGVDVIIEEGQPVITISCFDPVRREAARRTLALLLEDGRIHPARIEEVLARVQSDMDRELYRLGEDAAFAVEVSGLHPQLVKLLGKLHFRTSYGQNVLKHTQEVAFLCGAMAADLGLDPKLGRRCGLLHDIGKAIDHEQEGSHPQLGYEALKRWGEGEIVANAALAHHEGHEPISAYTVIAAAADAISAARPGARSENVERYLKRLQQLEDIAVSYRGVQKAYAIQAGRELRVIVNGHQLGDQELPKVAREIARRIEQEVQFPGEVKVTIIRETRQTAVAR